MIDKGRCDKGFIWNPSNCECECDKSCDVGEYIDYENCKCKKRLIDKLVEECSENIEEKELHLSAVIHYETLKKIKHECGSCTIYIISFAVTIFISVIVYLYWYSKKIRILVFKKK